MMGKRIAFAVMLAALLIGAGARAEGLADNDRVSSAIRLFDAWISTQQEFLGIPSISVGIIYDQDLIWSKSYGHQDPDQGTPASSDTLYRIASHSKLFTSIAIMRLSDEGKLSIYDPVEKWLPEFKTLAAHADMERPVTIQNLLSHTAGLPREAVSFYWNTEDFPDEDILLEGLAEQEAPYPPSRQWKYSNLGLALAGEIVERASGREYGDFVQEEILNPLGMTATGTDALTEQARQNLAAGYGRRMPDGSRKRHKYSVTHAMASATGLYTSVEDFAKFAAWQFRLRENGGREVLEAETLRDMQRVHWLFPDWKTGWGLGFSINKLKKGVFVGHGGAIHGYRTRFGIIPDAKIGVVVLTSADDGNPQRYVDRILETIVPAIRMATKPETEDKPVPAHWAEELVGLYSSGAFDAKVLVLNGGLISMNPNAANLKGGLTPLIPIEGEDYIFRAEGRPGGPKGEKVIFERGEDGKVTRMIQGGYYMDRVN